jgi:Lrp/AsnC family transcriptional regulator for asnA, asnC and gidA
VSQLPYQIDDVDRQIMKTLQKDARTPFLEIARDLGVSGGMIHQRVDRLKASGHIVGSKFVLDPVKLGYGVTALVGVHLTRAQDYPDLLKHLQKFPTVVEAHYTTGTYAIMIKVCAKDMQGLYDFLTNKLQRIEGVRSTETFICLSSPIERNVQP